MTNITKLYAAYKAGYLGNNILDTYFSFVANMIFEEHLTMVEDTVIAATFDKRYTIKLPLPFVRQVLGVGVQNNCFIENCGKYSVVMEELKKYKFSETDFNTLWNQLISEFAAYCQTKDLDISSINISDFILSILDGTDEKILSGERVEYQESMPPIEYAWYSYAKEQGKRQTDLYSFIAALSASNITKQALFYAGENVMDYSGLHIYLDSPIVFALLGMDEEARTESYKTLVSDMLRSKCAVHVLSHNFQEVDGIIARAAGWATSTQYDLRKANCAARFFHDSQMDESEISDFCENIETKLNELGITVKSVNYDIFQDKFQEDENCLFDMIKTRYLEHGYNLPPEKEKSIQVDVRSIVMIYRERQGETATKLQNAKHIMLTSNNAIANVSKKYESNRSIQAGHIPACISADLFGAILWLNSPIQMLEYQKQKLLADCYAFLKPNKDLLDKYIQSLDEARNADVIDEKKFLFLRTHKVVLDSLMDITKGDYARFNSSTYLEVYEDIQAKSRKLYEDEVCAHTQTRLELEELKSQDAATIEGLKKKVDNLEEREKNRLLQKTKRLGWILTFLLVAFPYVVISQALDSIKIQYNITSGGRALIFIFVSILFLPFCYAKGKQWCFNFAKWITEKTTKNNTLTY